jgi:hypothetical protein
MRRVIVEVSGGLVTSVRSDVPIELVLVDHDNIEAGDPMPKLPQGSEHWPDAMAEDGPCAPVVDRSRCRVNPCTCHDDSAWTIVPEDVVAGGRTYPHGCDCGCRWA